MVGVNGVMVYATASVIVVPVRLIFYAFSLSFLIFSQVVFPGFAPALPTAKLSTVMSMSAQEVRDRQTEDVATLTV